MLLVDFSLVISLIRFSISHFVWLDYVFLNDLIVDLKTGQFYKRWSSKAVTGMSLPHHRSYSNNMYFQVAIILRQSLVLFQKTFNFEILYLVGNDAMNIWKLVLCRLSSFVN